MAGLDDRSESSAFFGNKMAEEVQMPVNYQERLERSPRVAGGETVIKGTRVTLRTVLASLAEGASTEEIVRDFPPLTESDVRAAIAFAAASALENLPVAETHIQ